MPRCMWLVKCSLVGFHLMHYDEIQVISDVIVQRVIIIQKINVRSICMVSRRCGCGSSLMKYYSTIEGTRITSSRR